MIDLRGYQAKIFEDQAGFFADTVRLWLVLPRAQFVSVLMQDGSWRDVPEAERFPDEAGMQIPRSAISSIAQAISEWQGASGHPQTEVAILREWLQSERERLDRLVFGKAEKQS